jgi:hypothetical protein
MCTAYVGSSNAEPPVCSTFDPLKHHNASLANIPGRLAQFLDRSACCGPLLFCSQGSDFCRLHCHGCRLVYQGTHYGATVPRRKCVRCTEGKGVPSGQDRGMCKSRPAFLTSIGVHGVPPFHTVVMVHPFLIPCLDCIPGQGPPKRSVPLHFPEPI